MDPPFLMKQVERTLGELLPQTHHPYATLFASAKYSLLGPGKRLRPLLALETTQALGGCLESALQPACALEMVHAYSLIHDDLPCMDDDDYRRGQPTLHKVYPQWQAVLTGDFLLTYAFEVLTQAPFLSESQKLQLIGTLSTASGAHGMLGGQVLDLASEGQQLSLLQLQELHSKKTAALIVASIEFGAILSGAQASTREHLKEFGQALGLAFQVVDDILDVTHPEKKGRSSDTENEKATYVSLLGLEEAQRQAAQLHDQALQALGKVEEGDTSSLRALTQKLLHRSN